MRIILKELGTVIKAALPVILMFVALFLLIGIVGWINPWLSPQGEKVVAALFLILGIFISLMATAWLIVRWTPGSWKKDE